MEHEIDPYVRGENIREYGYEFHSCILPAREGYPQPKLQLTIRVIDLSTSEVIEAETTHVKYASREAAFQVLAQLLKAYCRFISTHPSKQINKLEREALKVALAKNIDEIDAEGI